MRNIITKLKEIEYPLILGQAIIVHLFVNLGQFLFHLLQTDTVYNCQFDNGAFFLNGNQIGYEFKQSISFILFLFVTQIVYLLYNKRQSIKQS